MIKKTAKKSNAKPVKASGKKTTAKLAKDAAGSEKKAASKRKHGGPSN